jgi:hypothetical protein
MKRLTVILLLFSFSSYSQSTDFLLLKKRDRTIATYYVGNHITFTTVTGAYIDADITQIRNDTLYLQQFIIQQVPTTLGVYVLDTTGSYRFQYHYNQIKAIDNASNHFDLSASGASLIGGGAVIVLASGIVYLADNKDFSPALLIAGVALAGVGYIIGKSNGKGMLIGKKYKLIYIQASNEKNK